MADKNRAPSDLASLRATLEALRQDVETQTAINIVEGVNTAETLALLGHWMRTRRTPTPPEIASLEKLARQRWSEQVRHFIALAKGESGGIDRSLGVLLGNVEGAPEPRPSRAARKPQAPARGRARKPRKR
jgi:hypothetical protein